MEYSIIECNSTDNAAEASHMPFLVQCMHDILNNIILLLGQHLSEFWLCLEIYSPRQFSFRIWHRDRHKKVRNICCNRVDHSLLCNQFYLTLYHNQHKWNTPCTNHGSLQWKTACWNKNFSWGSPTVYIYPSLAEHFPQFVPFGEFELSIAVWRPPSKSNWSCGLLIWSWGGLVVNPGNIVTGGDIDDLELWFCWPWIQFWMEFEGGAGEIIRLKIFMAYQ